MLALARPPSVGGVLTPSYKGGVCILEWDNPTSLFHGGIMKTYDNVTIKEEKDNVILSTPSMTMPLIIPREVWRAIVADHVKDVMKGEPRPDNVTITYDSGIPWD